ncbi:MAG: apolipoprotein N-acyltransferase [Ignavibacteriaceae bacterium]
MNFKVNIFKSHRTPEEKRIIRKERFLLILSGLLLGISFPPFPFPFQLFMFVALLPYFYVISNRETLSGINRATYLMAFVFCLITIYWVGSWQPEADTFLIIGGSVLLFFNPIVFLIPSSIYYFARKSFSPSVALYLFPFFWVTYEYAYTLTDASFPWLTLGQGLSHFLAFIQIADMIGAYGLSLLVLFINIFFYRLFNIYKKTGKISVTFSLFILASFFLIIAYGLNKLSTYEISDQNVKIGVIQPDINPWRKWDVTSLDKLLNIYLELSSETVQDSVNLIIWPETSLPVYLTGGGYAKQLNEIYQFIRNNKVYLLTGMPDIRFFDADEFTDDAKFNEQENFYYATYNSIMLFSPYDYKIEKYGKIKLVPLGERVPFADDLPFLKDLIKWGVGISGWNVGKDTILFSLPSVSGADTLNKDTLKINGLVCYESVYPDFVAEFVKRGADMIVVVTNDSWYGNSSGPYQHKEASVLRAIENRRSVIRSANGGISCYINPLGETIVETEMFERTKFTALVPVQKEKTFYTSYPLIIPVISSVISIWICGIFILKKIKNKFNL